MSIFSAMVDKDTKFVIPCAGKKLMTGINKNDEALAFVLNKGYLETTDRMEMENLIDEMEDFVLVGNIDCVKYKYKYVYRQRIFFKSLKNLLSFIQQNGISLEFPFDFRISTNNLMNILSELPALEIYANKYSETIDEYLTNTLIVNLYYLLDYMGIDSNIKTKVNKILSKKVGYMDNAPFLISHYDLAKKQSSIFTHLQYCSDERLFTIDTNIKNGINYGYTKSRVKSDRKAGILKKNASRS